MKGFLITIVIICVAALIVLGVAVLDDLDRSTVPVSAPALVLTPAPVQTPAPVVSPQRESVMEILKANATAHWGSDYEMVKYEYENQVEAYDWVVSQASYSSIMKKAKQKWEPDYEMVK